MNELLAVDINENGLYLLERRLRKTYNGRLQVDIVDIRDRVRVESLVAALQSARCVPRRGAQTCAVDGSGPR